MSDDDSGGALFVIDKKGNQLNAEGENQQQDVIIYHTDSAKKRKARKDGNPKIRKPKTDFKYDPDEEEKELAKAVFGDDESLLENLGKESSRVQKEISKQIFKDDKEEEEVDSDQEHIEESNQDFELEGPKPAWIDENDEVLQLNAPRLNRLQESAQLNVNAAEYEEALRAQYQRVHGTQDWARIATEEEETEAALLRSTAPLVNKSNRLAPENIDYIKMRDANYQERSSGIIHRAAFHPNSQLLFTAGIDKHLRLFQVDGKNNKKVQSVFLKDLPIIGAEFTTDGSEIIMTGRRKFFYTFNLGAGKVERVNLVIGQNENSLERLYMSPDDKYITILGDNGEIIMLSRQSKQKIFSLKMNGYVSSAAFSPKGEYLYTSGSHGEVYKWDLNTRRCCHRFIDEGSIHTTCLSVSPDGNYLAAGAESGIVNIYDIPGLDKSPKPTPKSVLTHLTTKATKVKFNPFTHLLATASVNTKNASKLIHIPTFTGYRNWPMKNSGLNFVSDCEFSQNGAYFALGTEHGTVQLYRLNHYLLS